MDTVTTDFVKTLAKTKQRSRSAQSNTEIKVKLCCFDSEILTKVKINVKHIFCFILIVVKFIYIYKGLWEGVAAKMLGMCRDIQ